MKHRAHARARESRGAAPRASSAAPAGTSSGAPPGAPPGAHDYLAVCAPGLEPLAEAELRALGLDVPRDGIEPGGVAFRGGLDALYTANLWLRTASRVLVRVGGFEARTFADLERLARRLPWSWYLAPGRETALRVTCRKSRLYHSGAVTERVAGAVERVTARAPGVATPEDGTPTGAGDAQLVVVRLVHDRCTVSIDSSGALLHRRGYRLATARAPLRETLAAAALLAAGWDTATPLVDPLCGAGTIAIEAALIARGIAPGLHRDFAFAHWPGFDAARWGHLLEDARRAARPAAPAPIVASDRDAGAIAATQANAERAGVAMDIDARVAALSAIAPPAGVGCLLTNPPYGRRIGDRLPLRDLYAQLGHVARARCAGWLLALLSADITLERQVGIPLHTALRTRNGGIPVRLVMARVP